MSGTDLLTVMQQADAELAKRERTQPGAPTQRPGQPHSSPPAGVQGGSLLDVMQQADAALSRQAASTSRAAAPAAPPSLLQDIGRQVGLTVRHGITGLTALPAVVGNGLNTLTNYGIDAVNGVAGTKLPHLGMVTDLVQNKLTQAGLPEPQTTTERLVGDVASGMAGAGGSVALGKGLTKAAGTIAQKTGKMLATTPGNQVVAGGTAGGASGAAREAGLPAPLQLAAGLAGAAVGSMGAGAAASAARAPIRAVSPAAAEALAPGTAKVIPKAALNNAVEAVTEGLPASARETVAARANAALSKAPNANPVAAARLAQFRQMGVEPTLGQITRDPAQWSWEQNIRSQAPEVAHRLQQQNQQIADFLNRMGGGTAPELNEAGTDIMRGLHDVWTNKGAAVSNAYNDVRASSGVSADVPLQGLAQDYARVLNDFADAVPSGVRNRFEGLGLLSGKQAKVFSVNDAEDMIKHINMHDGPTVSPATSAALGQLRDAVKTAVSNAGSGDVYAPARTLASQRFQMADTTPGMAAVSRGSWSPDGQFVGGITPEQFVQRHVLGGGADNVNNMVSILRENGQSAPIDRMRQLTVDYLRRGAFGADPAGDAIFKPAGYQSALDRLGSPRLGALFTPDEVGDLQTLGRVGGYINQRPSIGWNNTSNTGATLMDLAKNIPGAKGAVEALANRMAIAKALQANLDDALNPLSLQSQGPGMAPVVLNGALRPGPAVPQQQ